MVDGLVTGELFDMPAGSVGFAFGIQYRSKTLGYDYDEFTNLGDRTFVGQANDFLNTGVLQRIIAHYINAAFIDASGIDVSFL